MKDPDVRDRNNAPENSPEAVPPWVPQGESLDRIGPELRTVLVQTIQPLYEELVHRVSNPYRREIGRTMVHLAWLEARAQVEQASEPDAGPMGVPPPAVDDLLQNCMRIGMSKVRMIGCLLRIQQIGANSKPSPADLSPMSFDLSHAEALARFVADQKRELPE